MREGIGAYATLNIVIIYIMIVIALLVASLNYYKGYKVNSQIISTISQYEGYNKSAQNKIDSYLDGIGYASDQSAPQCPKRNDMENFDMKTVHSKHAYCVYYTKSGNYTTYGVTTYIYIDLPLFNLIRVPIYTKGERIYNFG